MIDNHSSGLTVTEELCGDTALNFVSYVHTHTHTHTHTQDQYGVDWEGPIPYISEEEGISIPEVTISLSDADVAQLTTLYIPSNKDY